MGTWIEFRCENRCEPSAENTPWETDGCWSHRNAGPMELAEDTRVDLIATVRTMERQARGYGWIRTKEGWVCPYCAPRLQPDP